MYEGLSNLTSMSSFIKAKLKKSDDQTKVAANITEYHIYLSKNHHSKIHNDKAIISEKNVKNQHV